MMQDRLIKGGEYDSHLIKKVPAATMREMLDKAKEKSTILPEFNNRYCLDLGDDADV